MKEGHSADMAALHQREGMKIKDLAAIFPQYSQRSVYRHPKRKIRDKDSEYRRKYNKGRPRVMSMRDQRNLLREIPRLRRTERSFIMARLALEVGLLEKVKLRTVRKYLNKSGYFYLQVRKKGLLTKTQGISMYLDGKGFAWKRNPQLKISHGLQRHASGEGTVKDLTLDTAKAGKAGVLCERYYGNITGEKFAKIVKEKFPESFANSANPREKRVLQDNCPKQNSAAAKKPYTMCMVKYSPFQHALQISTALRTFSPWSAGSWETTPCKTTSRANHKRSLKSASNQQWGNSATKKLINWSRACRKGSTCILYIREKISVRHAVHTQFFSFFETFQCQESESNRIPAWPSRINFWYLWPTGGL